MSKRMISEGTEKKKVIPVHGGKQVFEKCIASIRKTKAEGGGARTAVGEERREGGKERREENLLLGGKTVVLT